MTKLYYLDNINYNSAHTDILSLKFSNETSGELNDKFKVESSGVTREYNKLVNVVISDGGSGYVLQNCTYQDLLRMVWSLGIFAVRLEESPAYKMLYFKTYDSGTGYIEFSRVDVDSSTGVTETVVTVDGNNTVTVTQNTYT